MFKFLFSSSLVLTLIVTFLPAIFALIGGIAGCFGSGLEASLPGGESAIDACYAGFAAVGLGISGFFLGLAGTLFDFMVFMFVTSLSSLLSQTSLLGEAIGIGWRVFRDIANLAFIAGLVWASIAMILQAGTGTNKPGPLIIKILIAALLVNFSYFFGAVIIDASNFVSKKVYEEAILIGEPTTSIIGNPLAGGVNNFIDQAPITERFMAATGLGSLENFRNGGGLSTVEGSQPLLIAFLTIFLFSVATGVFFTAGLLLLGRVAVIIVLLVTSPVGVLYFTGLPVVSGWGKQWWKTLQDQALFPPIFLILTAINLKIIEALASSSGNVGDFIQLITQSNSVPDIFSILNRIVIFALASLLIKMSLDVAKNMAQGIEVTLPTAKGIYKYPIAIGGLISRESIKKVLGGGVKAVARDVSKVYGPAFKDVGRGLGATGDATLTAFDKADEALYRSVGLGSLLEGKPLSAGRFSEEVKKERLRRIKDISRKDPSAVTDADRKYWEKTSEEVREQALKKASGKQRKTLLELEAGSSVTTSASGKKEEPEKTDDSKGDTKEPKKEKPDDTKPSGKDTTSASLSSTISQIEGAIRSGDQRQLSKLNDLTNQEVYEVLLARKSLLSDQRNTEKLARALGGDRFNEVIKELPPETITKEIITAVAPHLNETGYGALKTRSDLKEDQRRFLDSQMQQKNAAVKRNFETGPAGSIF